MRLGKLGQLAVQLAFAGKEDESIGEREQCEVGFFSTAGVSLTPAPGASEVAQESGSAGDAGPPWVAGHGLCEVTRVFERPRERVSTPARCVG
jgi:hypothetical protein